MTDEDFFQRVRDIAQDPWAKMMIAKGKKKTTAKELKVFSALRAKAGKIVMLRAAAAGLAEEQALVNRLTRGD